MQWFSGALETGLLARQLFEFAFGGLCLFSLQITATMRVGLTLALNYLAAPDFGVRRSGDINNSEINAQPDRRYLFSKDRRAESRLKADSLRLNLL